MKFDVKTFHDELEKDLTVNPDTINAKVYDIPKLYSKYMRWFFEQRNIFIKVERERSRLYKELYHHYTYEVPDSLTNKEIEFHILADEKYSGLLAKSKYQEGIVDDLDKAAKRIEKLSFDVKNIIDLLKYLQGV